jgi:hypothetical protein
MLEDDPLASIRTGCKAGRTENDNASSASKHGWIALHCLAGAAVEHVEQDQSLVVEGSGARDRGDETEGKDGATVELEVDAEGQVDVVGRASGVIAVSPVAVGQGRVDVNLEGGGDRRQPVLRIGTSEDEIGSVSH